MEVSLLDKDNEYVDKYHMLNIDEKEKRIIVNVKCNNNYFLHDRLRIETINLNITNSKILDDILGIKLYPSSDVTIYKLGQNIEILQTLFGSMVIKNS